MPSGVKVFPSGAQVLSKTAPDRFKTESGEPQDEFVARSLRTALFDKLQHRILLVLSLARVARDVYKTWQIIGYGDMSPFLC